ncbi:MAG: hypothetical protein QM687_04105 [Ferruginibacter sp.]
MKTFKVLFAGLFAIAMAAGIFAFSSQSKSGTQKTATRGAGLYRYTEASDNISDLQAPGHWELITSAPSDCFDTGDIPCYVNYTGSDFDNFLSGADLDDLLDISVKEKYVAP